AGPFPGGHRPDEPGGDPPGDLPAAVHAPPARDLSHVRDIRGEHDPPVRPGGKVCGRDLRRARAGVSSAGRAARGQGARHAPSAGPLRRHRPRRSTAPRPEALLRRAAPAVDQHRRGLTVVSTTTPQTGVNRPGRGAGARTMRLRYGLNETVNWHQFAAGAHREEIRARFLELDTRVVRLLAFEKGAPDPVESWEPFAGCVQAGLPAGAVPMVTFAKFGPPYDAPVALRHFARRCAAVVARCVRQWGGAAVRDWYWGVWQHPNSEWVSAGLTFDHYRRIYEETARAILAHLSPFLEGRRPLIGGPAAAGFPPFWADWVWRFVNEIDNALIGFASWHHFGDWREVGAWGAPADERTFRTLLLARVSEYESRARAVARMLRGRGILNVCGELNAHA